MKTILLVTALSLALGAGMAQAQWRGGVFVYDPQAPFAYGARDYRYDPRSPYPPPRDYRSGLPPRYDGRLPPRYYERHMPGRDERYWRHAERFPPHRPGSGGPSARTSVTGSSARRCGTTARCSGATRAVVITRATGAELRRGDAWG